MIAFECIAVAIAAWVFFNVLSAPGMILEPWYTFLERVNNRAPWLAKPLGYCGVCFSGQCAFWYYLVEYRAEWSLTEHILFTCNSIFFFLVIKQWANKNELV